ncbi:hypothetical protein [Nesterenkonia pannonica]|uniref:hypothetical protein n=1 Tax=Nesterenkonia pannonica TaxID=1548602 RepID=UPI0021648C42|nr:hypothetical protein [Nesterenkonia pannonica]
MRVELPHVAFADQHRLEDSVAADGAEISDAQLRLVGVEEEALGVLRVDADSHGGHGAVLKVLSHRDQRTLSRAVCSRRGGMVVLLG